MTDEVLGIVWGHIDKTPRKQWGFILFPDIPMLKTAILWEKELTDHGQKDIEV